jgi:hypothetical protein
MPIFRGSRQGGSPSDYMIERFEKFLINDWVHMEKKVSALDAKVGLIIGMLTLLIGLMVYTVVK